MKQKTLAIRADANKTIGIGHIMRCMALGQAWQKRHGNVLFISNLQNQLLRQMVRNQGFELISICPQPSVLSDIHKTITALQANDVQWIVIDGYHFDVNYYKALHEKNYKILIIDDYNHLSFYYADILLNQNLESTKFRFKSLEKTVKLLGPKYLMLRNEFISNRPKKRNFNPIAKNILITMGGTDPYNICISVLKTLYSIELNNISVKIITGFSDDCIKSIKNELNYSQFETKLIPNANNMPSLMSWADIAISAGGSTAWELSYMGVPTIYIGMADNQRLIVKALEEASAGLNAGWYDNLNISLLSETIKNLIYDSEKRQLLSKNAANLIPGSGVELILNCLCSITQKDK